MAAARLFIPWLCNKYKVQALRNAVVCWCSLTCNNLHLATSFALQVMETWLCPMPLAAMYLTFFSVLGCRGSCRRLSSIDSPFKSTVPVGSVLSPKLFLLFLTAGVYVDACRVENETGLPFGLPQRFVRTLYYYLRVLWIIALSVDKWDVRSSEMCAR